MRGRLLLGGTAVVGALVAAACAPAAAQQTLAPAAHSVSSPAAAVPATGSPSALSLLGGLRVAAPGSMTGYSRDAFGPAWADVDHNGCDQRNDVLRRDLSNVVTKPGTHDCVVASGTLHDRYTGQTIAFVRGPNSAKVQIDHVVPLGDAWTAGASSWTAAQREAFSGDLRNLLAVDGPANEAKSDKTADQWLPPNKAEACDYVTRQVVVKNLYGLSVTPTEASAMRRVLAGCPS